MLGMLGRLSLAVALVLTGTSSLLAQGSFVLGADDWTDYGGVSALPGTWTGVTVNESEVNDDFSTADAVAVGDDYAGSIDASGYDEDYLAFSVVSGDTIHAQTVDVSGLGDTQLTLYDTDGTTELVFDDDGGAGLLSALGHTCSATGTYFLKVGSYSNGIGAYKVEIRLTVSTSATGSWVYIQKTLEAVAPGVTRAGADGSVAVLGAADSTAVERDAGAAYHYCVPLAAAGAPLTGTVTFHDTAANIATFFSDLSLGNVNPSIIILPGSGSNNDMDATEAAELVTNASAIGSYLSSGGGLIAHGSDYFDTSSGAYDWLPLVFSGAVVTQDETFPTLSNQGKFSLPAMLEADHHTSADGYFVGHSLDVYMTSPGDISAGAWSGVTANESEPNNSHLTADMIVVGDDYNGNINVSGTDPADYASFFVSAGDTVLFETVVVSGISDTKLYLYDTDGTTQLAYDDDGGTGFLSLISHKFTTSGFYYLAVEPYDATYTGAYTMEVRLGTEGPIQDVVIGSLPSAWNWLGNALAGVAGEPLVVPSGTLQAGSPWSMLVTNSAPNTTAFMIFGLSTLYAPVKGGVLVPATTFIFPLPINASGELSLGSTLGSPPVGATFYAQFWIIDAAGPAGYSASNAFSGTIQ